MATKVDFPVFDADHHLYETEEAFTRYLAEEHRSLFRYVNVDGRTKVVIRGMLSDYIPNPTFEVVARPGAWSTYFAGDGEGKTVREMMGEPMRSIPAFRNPKDRLELLDEQGVHSALMFPTLASLVEVNFLDLPDVTLDLLSAFNRWMLDEWTYNYEDRIFPTPILNPCVPDRAIEELEFILDNGAKVALLRPGLVAGCRSPGSSLPCTRPTPGIRSTSMTGPESPLSSVRSSQLRSEWRCRTNGPPPTPSSRRSVTAC